MPVAPRRFGFAQPAIPRHWANGSKRTVTGRALQRERDRLFKGEPVCRECDRNGRTTVATIRDHIVPLAFGGRDIAENTQPLCRDCHDAKTKQESSEGARASRFQER